MPRLTRMRRLTRLFRSETAESGAAAGSDADSGSVLDLMGEVPSRRYQTSPIRERPRPPHVGSFPEEVSRPNVEAMMAFYGYVSEVESHRAESKHDVVIPEGSFRVPVNTIRDICHSICESYFFLGVVGILLIANAICMGILLDMTTAEQDERAWVGELEGFFLVCFLCEVTVRIIGSRIYPWRDPWLVLDFTIISVGCLDTWVLRYVPSMGNVDFTVLLVIRLFRLGRFIRIFRAGYRLRPLRIIMCAAGQAAHSVFWVFVALLGFFYMFALMFRTLLRDVTAEDPLYAVTDKYFGSCGDFIVTALGVVCKGFDWTHEITFVLMSSDEYWAACAVWMVFVIFTQFGVCNLIIGIFVEELLRVAEASEARVQKNQLVNKVLNPGNLKAWFNDMDKNNTGSIDFFSFKETLKTNKKLQHALDIEPDQADQCFQAIDLRGKGYINLEDFMYGVVKLRCGSKSVDTLSFDYQIRQIMHSVHTAPAQADELARRLGNFESRLEAFSKEFEQHQAHIKSQIPDFLMRLEGVESQMGTLMGALRDPLQMSASSSAGATRVRSLHTGTDRDGRPVADGDITGHLSKRGKVGEHSLPIPDTAMTEAWILPKSFGQNIKNGHPAIGHSINLSNIRESYHIQTEMKKLRQILKAATAAATDAPYAKRSTAGKPVSRDAEEPVPASREHFQPVLQTNSTPDDGDTPGGGAPSFSVGLAASGDAALTSTVNDSDEQRIYAPCDSGFSLLSRGWTQDELNMAAQASQSFADQSKQLADTEPTPTELETIRSSWNNAQSLFPMSALRALASNRRSEAG